MTRSDWRWFWWGLLAWSALFVGLILYAALWIPPPPVPFTVEIGR